MGSSHFAYSHFAYHCKKLEVDLTQENVISVALRIHLGPGSGPPPVAMVKGSLVPTPLSEKSRRGLATVPYNGLSRAVCTVCANQIAEFRYVTLITS